MDWAGHGGAGSVNALRNAKPWTERKSDQVSKRAIPIPEKSF